MPERRSLDAVAGSFAPGERVFMAGASGEPAALALIAVATPALRDGLRAQWQAIADTLSVSPI